MVNLTFRVLRHVLGMGALPDQRGAPPPSSSSVCASGQTTFETPFPNVSASERESSAVVKPDKAAPSMFWRFHNNYDLAPQTFVSVSDGPAPGQPDEPSYPALLPVAELFVGIWTDHFFLQAVEDFALQHREPPLDHKLFDVSDVWQIVDKAEGGLQRIRQESEGKGILDAKLRAEG